MELLGGSGLLLGGLRDVLPPGLPLLAQVASLEVKAVSARALFLLTLAVTPANIYMFTHNAQMTGMGDLEPQLSFHLVRGLVQVVVLGLLWRMASQTTQE